MLRQAPVRRLALVATVAAVAALPHAASAQQVAVIVNGAPITTYDIEQRSKFMMLATHKAPSRQEVIEELIDEKLKVQIGQRYKLEVTDSEVDTAYSNMAQRMHATQQQLTQMLAQAGVDAQTLKAKIRADISWQQIVRGKFQSSLQVREVDIAKQLAKNNQEDKKEVGYEYTLRPILFLTPPGASEAVIDARKRDAEGLKVRFQNCNDGLPFARALRDVAVRDQIVKTSADLPEAQRKILDELEVGRLSSPEVTPSGIQMFALCARRENKVDGAATREAREALFAEQFQTKSKRYLAELRKQAMIEVK
jgi:peptidyl-prolyl cis-trans isomerase SurA